MPVRRERGFTLVEVLIAFAILAMVLIAVFRALAIGHRSVNEQATRIEAARLAQSKLETLGISEGLAAGLSDGRFDERYRWEMEVTPYASQFPSDYEAARRPYWVRLTVLWPHRSGRRDASLTLTTIKLAAPL